MDNKMRTEDDLRIWLGKQLRPTELPGWLWQALREYGYVEEALSHAAKRQLLRQAKRSLRSISESSDMPAGRTAYVSEDPSLGLYEKEWQQAASEHLAKEAGSIPRVRRFREQVLGVTVAPKQVLDFLLSPALAYLPHGHLEELGIPLTRHFASLEASRAGDVIEAKIRIIWPDGEHEERLRLDAGQWPGKYLFSVSERGVYAWPGSVLDDLWKLSGWLAERSAWRPEHAAWFILTAATPPISLLQVHTAAGGLGIHTFGRITIDVDPRVPAELVHRLYRKHQRSMLGGEIRTMGNRNLTVFRFMTERTDENGERPKLSDLMAEWNRLQPKEWHYKEVSNFGRDYKRAQDWLVRRSYDPFGAIAATREPETEVAERSRDSDG